MKKINILTIYVSLLGVMVNAQTPCVGGFAGSYPCSGYDLMSHIDVNTLTNSSSNSTGSDIWGWTDPLTGKEYALMTTNRNTVFIDISNPVNPIILGRLETASSVNMWRDVKVYNDHAYIVADNVGSHGMQIFDLTRLRNVTNAPETFTEDALYSGFGSAHNIVINEDTGYAYPVGTSRGGTYGGGPLFLNIQNPTNPVDEGGFFGYSHDAQSVIYNGPDTDYIGREIYVGSNENQIVIADITNKSNPTLISSIAYTNVSYTHQGWLTDDHSYFLLGDEIDELNFGGNTRTIIFDFTDLDAPIVKSEYFGPTMAVDHNGYVKGNTFYLANYRAGVRMIDISNIANGNMTNSQLTEIGYFDTFSSNDSAGFSGAWSVYPYFSSGNIIISDINGGFFIIRESGTLSTETVNQYQLKIFPNPTSSNITIQSNNNLNSVALSNALGQKISQTNNINSLNHVLNLESLPQGIYWLTINNSITKKVVRK